MVRFPTTKVPKRRLTGTRAALSVIWGAGSLRRGVGGTPFGSPLVLRYTHRRPDHRRKTRHQVALVLVAEPDHPFFEGAPEAKQATERRLGLQIATRLLNGLRKVAGWSRLEPVGDQLQVTGPKRNHSATSASREGSATSSSARESLRPEPAHGYGITVVGGGRTGRLPFPDHR